MWGSITGTAAVVVASAATEADTWWSRFRGLMFRPHLGDGEALKIEPCTFDPYSAHALRD